VKAGLRFISNPELTTEATEAGSVVEESGQSGTEIERRAFFRVFRVFGGEKTSALRP
jgi:hypothetical protein